MIPINGRRPKKIYEINAATNTARFKEYVLAVNETKAEIVFRNKYRYATILSISYYGEILK